MAVVGESGRSRLTSLFSAGLLGFFFLRRYFGKFIAFSAVALTIFNFSFVYERGNLTEEYALPFQFAAIFLLGKIEQTGKSAWYLVGIGSLLAMASSLKQPLAGIGVAIFAYLAITYLLRNDWRGLLVACGLVGLGFVAVWAVWFAYFAITGIFADFWEAAFQYNLALSGISISKRLLALLASLDKWGRNSGYFLGGMVAWLTLLPYLISKDDRLLRFSSSRWLGAGVTGVGLVATLKGLLILFCAAGLTRMVFYRFGSSPACPGRFDLVRSGGEVDKTRPGGAAARGQFQPVPSIADRPGGLSRSFLFIQSFGE